MFCCANLWIDCTENGRGLHRAQLHTFIFYPCFVVFAVRRLFNERRRESFTAYAARRFARKNITESASVFPSFLDNQPGEMQLIYQAVSQHQNLLEQIPCYCGCGDSVGHKDNYDCFIYKNHEDGSLVWDDHATRCQVCLDIAAESIVLYREGKSIQDIRDFIDKQYKEGYAEPTPTPDV